MQIGLRAARVGGQPAQVGAQAGAITFKRVEFEFTTRKLRQAFAEAAIKRSASSDALRTWARSHWR